jgi:structural maintenance of chromosome 3 (chondroitin sulfate proteoglycan 6)
LLHTRRVCCPRGYPTKLLPGLSKAQRQLYGTISREVATGIEAVKRIKKEHDMKGVYAPVIELFSCTDKEMTAIEVASKGHLFNFIVDTDVTASKLLEMYVHSFLEC